MQRSMAAVFLWLLFLSPNLLPAQGTLLVFSGDLRGEIQPCGCAEEGDMGGLLRRLTFFKQQLSNNPKLLYFDLGNNFPEPSGQGDLKVSLIHASLKKMNPQVVLLGPNEWLNGLQSLDDDVPYLLSNQSGKLNLLNSKTIKQGGLTLSVSGYLSPQLVYQNQNEESVILPVNSRLLSSWHEEALNENSSFRILLFRGNEVELDKFGESGIFDLIVVGSTNDNELQQVMEIKTPRKTYPMIPTKGQGLLTGKLTESGKLIPENKNGVPAGLSVTWLRGDFEDAPELEETFRAYDSAVKELFFSNLERMEKQRKESPFLGNEVCAVCHAESITVWGKSRHAHAFRTLENKGKHFDPECLECHVVGLKPWKAPETAPESALKFEGGTGFLSLQTTPHLKNVQCENCHGPARAHLENNKVPPALQNPKSSCVGCHQGSHSPLFNFETYWPKIKH